jgi:hypothetical protein
MREDYTFYNCYCYDKDPIDFKAYVLNQLRDLGYFNWLRDEPRWIKDEKDFLNSTQRIPYLEKEIEGDKTRVKKAKDFLKQLEEHPDEEYAKYVKDETEKWQAQYNTKIHNSTDYATERTEYLNIRADEFASYITKWTPPDEFLNITGTLSNQLLTVREEAKKIQSDRAFFYEKLPDKPELMSKEEFISTNEEDCEETIKRCSGYISDNKKNIKRMKKQDETTHKLFESFKVFDN